ncbi:MAG: AmmeMemoRadiSam system protein B, partial [bacterium]|nr:AmmeMemoRadiSam system protein B [bacterium]
VPHAGWAYSGRVAGRVFATIAAAANPVVVVLFGAMHRRGGSQAALFPSGRWQIPGGAVEVDERLAERVLGHTNLIVEDPYAHETEHSIEVQLPLVRQLMPEARILPIMVPPISDAVHVGEAVARTLEAYGTEASVVGSTDLTHYGPAYCFVPHGEGDGGSRWAKEVNDRRMIDCMLALDPERVVPEADEHRNACGAGAIAATVSAVRSLGANRAVLLEHTTSFEVSGRRGGADSVGYAGVVFAEV